jgi:hypothetical protein
LSTSREGQSTASRLPRRTASDRRAGEGRVLTFMCVLPKSKCKSYSDPNALSARPDTRSVRTELPRKPTMTTSVPTTPARPSPSPAPPASSAASCCTA